MQRQVRICKYAQVLAIPEWLPVLRLPLSSPLLSVQLRQSPEKPILGISSRPAALKVSLLCIPVQNLSLVPQTPLWVQPTDIAYPAQPALEHVPS